LLREALLESIPKLRMARLLGERIYRLERLDIAQEDMPLERVTLTPASEQAAGLEALPER
jgi:hypothetical protein